MFMAVLFRFLLFALTAFGVHAYIPASPTNSTDAAIQQGLNMSDASKLQLRWYSDGSVSISLDTSFFETNWLPSCRSLSESVSYQLVGADSTGVSKGVLIHFSEDMVTNDTSTRVHVCLLCQG